MDWDEWRRLLEHDGKGSVLVLEQERDAGGPQIAGFVFVEFYPESRCGLISYLAVDAKCRRRGYGRELVAQAIQALKAHAADQGSPLRAVFAEIHDPSADPDREVMDANDRVSFFAGLGARRIPIPYVQPDLGQGFGPARLWLIAFPIDGPAPTVSGKDVRGFVRELYALHRSDTDGPLHEMEQALHDERLCLESLLRLSATGILEFAKYAIALHFVLSGPDSVLPQSSAEFASFDRDMLAYAYRDRPPFSNTTVQIPDAPHDLTHVSVRFSRKLHFVSEGCGYCLTDEKRADREMRLWASVTHFKGGDVYHLVLTPRSGSTCAALTEYDLIRLAKLWERGEEVQGDFAGVDSWIRFADSQEQVDLSPAELATRVFGERVGMASLRAGTLELVTKDMDGPTDWNDVWRAIGRLERRDAVSAFPSTGVRDAVEAVGGIFQALLDFREIDEEELSDVFDGARLGRHGLQGLHKGTLLSMLDEDRSLDAGLGSFGPSPYLMVPHAVLVHNEEILRADALDETAGSSGQTQEGPVSSRWVRHQQLEYLQNNVKRLRKALDSQYVPNVFHYPSERWIYAYGHETRGLVVREQHVRAQLGEMEANYEIATERRRRTADDARNALLLVLTFTAVHAVVHSRNEDFIVLTALTLLALIYWLVRR